jgi:hypothetical protein
MTSKAENGDSTCSELSSVTAYELMNYIETSSDVIFKYDLNLTKTYD